MTEQQGLVPERRFKEFQNTQAWEQREYGEVINLLSGQDFSPSEYNDTCNGIPYMTGASCIVGKETIVNRWTTVPRCLAEKGDVLLVCKGSGYGTIAVLAQDKAHIARQFMALKNRPNLDQVFNFYLLNSVIENIKKDARGLIAGIARDAVIKQEISIPLLEEQSRIGRLFTQLDNLITLHQRKLEKTGALKSAYLSEMFPAEGERVPKRRFAGFTDAWEQRELDSIYKKIRNAFVGTATPYYVDSGNFYLESNNVKDGQINRITEIFINDEFYEKQKDKWLHTGDLVMVQSGHVGHTAVIGEELDGTAAHALIMFQEYKEQVDPYFLNFQFQTREAKRKLENITTGNTIKHILASDMKKFEVSIPQIEEQQRIGSFFKQLDHLITLHQQRLEKLQNIKKAYLNELFV